MILELDGDMAKTMQCPVLCGVNSVKQGLSLISFCMLRTVSFIKVDRPPRLHVLAA